VSRRVKRWQSHLAALRRDPVLLAMVAWTLLAALLFNVFAGHPHWQVRVFWHFQPPLDALLTFYAWRSSRIATGAIRRFWLVLTAAGAMFTTGDSYQAVLTVVDPGNQSSTGGDVQTAFFGVGLISVVLAMLVHPHPDRTGRDRLTFWLDAATVLVGGAVVAWCFAASPADSGASDVVGTLVAGGVLLSGTFAAIKMILSGNAPMNKVAALPMMSSAVAMSLGIYLAAYAQTALAPLVFTVGFLPSLLIAVGPRIQVIVAQIAPVPFGERRRKPYSLLPYGSMAVAFGTLVIVLPSGDTTGVWGAVIGLGLICAMVAVRQLVAFHENTRLIRQLREHEARLRHQALFDGLTGLANRTHFHERVGAARAAGGPVSLLLIDLDGFKSVNDTRGHAAGDALLCEVADRLRETVRGGDLAARLGCDEFAVLLPDCTTAEADRTAQRILDALLTPVSIDGAAVGVSASIGVAAADATDDVESLLHDADLAMYAAKNSGKGAWLRYEPSMGSMSVA
jgi:diguanylate cyclase (GGDEF)-like protein